MKKLIGLIEMPVVVMVVTIVIHSKALHKRVTSPRNASPKSPEHGREQITGAATTRQERIIIWAVSIMMMMMVMIMVMMVMTHVLPSTAKHNQEQKKKSAPNKTHIQDNFWDNQCQIGSITVGFQRAKIKCIPFSESIKLVFVSVFAPTKTRSETQEFNDCLWENSTVVNVYRIKAPENLTLPRNEALRVTRNLESLIALLSPN